LQHLVILLLFLVFVEVCAHLDVPQTAKVSVSHPNGRLILESLSVPDVVENPVAGTILDYLAQLQLLNLAPDFIVVCLKSVLNLPDSFITVVLDLILLRVVFFLCNDLSLIIGRKCILVRSKAFLQVVVLFFNSDGLVEVSIGPQGQQEEEE